MSKWVFFPSSVNSLSEASLCPPLILFLSFKDEKPQQPYSSFTSLAGFETHKPSVCWDSWLICPLRASADLIHTLLYIIRRGLWLSVPPWKLQEKHPQFSHLFFPFVPLVLSFCRSPPTEDISVWVPRRRKEPFSPCSVSAKILVVAFVIIPAWIEVVGIFKRLRGGSNSPHFWRLRCAAETSLESDKRGFFSDWSTMTS